MNAQLTTQSRRLITPDHLRRFAVVYIRQSSEKQIRENTGSTEYQRSLVSAARAYGWPDSQIKIIDEDLGKSALSSQGRTGWQQLQEMIEAGQVGVVFVANISRLSRQVLDFEVFRICAALHKTLLYSDGRFSDPANANDAIVSQMMAIVAHFENRKRTEIFMQSKLTKAKRGDVVSRLPVGWVKRPDGKFDYDPETEETIRTIIKTFWQTGAIRQTVIALTKAGIQIPCRKRNGQLCFKAPTVTRVTFILTHRAYTGTYVFYKTRKQPGASASGHSKREKLSEERWIKIPDHHPAYMTVEEQEEIKSILRKNQKKRRTPVARERTLTQGLIRCALCGSSVSVHYLTKKPTTYMCKRLREYAKYACQSFTSNDLDASILREVFKVLKAPPIEMLKAALEASRAKKQTRLDRIKSERDRLAREERAAEDLAELTNDNLECVNFAALEQLEKVLQEKKQFEQKIALERQAPADEASDEKVEELCRIASDVPGLWRHEAVTHQDRTAIVRCLINHIVVKASREKIEATIVWKSGAQTQVLVWRAWSHHPLIRELHAKQLTASEIKEHLAAGKTSTGQIINISVGGIQSSLRKMGLKAAKHSATYLSVRQKAVELDREGQSLHAIARYFNEQAFKSLSGKPWTHFMVEHLLHANGQKQESLESIHRRVITEARARGLTYGEMAEEFNKRQIRRRGGLRWTAKSVAIRWSDLKGMQLNRGQKRAGD